MKSGITELGDVTEVWATLDIKLSAAYNSIGRSVGMKMVLRKGVDPKRAVRMLEKKIESTVKRGTKDMTAFLNQAAKISR